MSEKTIQIVPTDTPEGEGGVKMRVSWGMIERLLKQERHLHPDEYLKSVEADMYGVMLTLGSTKDSR